MENQFEELNSFRDIFKGTKVKNSVYILYNGKYTYTCHFFKTKFRPLQSIKVKKLVCNGTIRFKFRVRRTVNVILYCESSQIFCTLTVWSLPLELATKLSRTKPSVLLFAQKYLTFYGPISRYDTFASLDSVRNCGK